MHAGNRLRLAGRAAGVAETNHIVRPDLRRDESARRKVFGTCTQIVGTGLRPKRQQAQIRRALCKLQRTLGVTRIEDQKLDVGIGDDMQVIVEPAQWRSEEHTSELQSLMRISYAVFCLKK